MAAADRGNGPLTSLSAHVTVGTAEWTGDCGHDFASEEGEAAEEEKHSMSRHPNGTSPDHRSRGSGCGISHIFM